jgi:T-complex protein 1 subunit delta
LNFLFLAVADVIRTSLGPRGMDKMIKDARGETLITNDGATILQKMDVVHPTAKMVKYLNYFLVSRNFKSSRCLSR